METLNYTDQEYPVTSERISAERKLFESEDHPKAALEYPKNAGISEQAMIQFAQANESYLIDLGNRYLIVKEDAVDDLTETILNALANKHGRILGYPQDSPEDEGEDFAVSHDGCECCMGKEKVAEMNRNGRVGFAGRAPNKAAAMDAMHKAQKVLLED